MMPIFTPPLNGKHVFLMFSAFFGVVIAVNGVFIYTALDTWTGLEQENAYVDGLQYNQTLAAKQHQEALGWQSALSVTPQKGGALSLVATFQDKAGAPLDTLSVRAELRRPTQEGHDRIVALTSKGNGEYQTETTLPLPGQWQVRILAEQGSAERFFAERRIEVP